jgi:O-antigen/teichoic acid export membrane protein
VIPYVRFGLRSAASQVLYQFYTNLDYAVVGYYFGAHANGVYSAAYSIVLEPVRTITNVVSDVAFPTFAKLRNDGAALGAQFIKFTRLNVIAVLPFIVIIALVIPDFGHVFFGHKQWDTQDPWTLADYAMLDNAVRILCLVGLLRALGFLGPPLLDGIGHPERTLRYMLVAAFVLTSMYLIGANALGARLGLLSVAIAWAIGYPLAFGVLAYLVVRAIDLPLREYGRQTWGLVACCAAGFSVGLVVSQTISVRTASVRLAIIGGSALVVMVTLLATWQKLTPATIRRAVRG